MKVLLWAMVIIGGVWVLGAMMESEYRQRLTESPASKVEHDKRYNRIALAATMAKSLRNAMRDPDSFKLSSALIVDKTGAVCYKYRSRNGFNGMTMGYAVLSWEGSFKTNEMDGFSVLWKRECANQSGSDEVVTVSSLIEQ